MYGTDLSRRYETELSRPGEPGLTTMIVEKGIQQQPGKSCTSQVLNLTQHIEELENTGQPKYLGVTLDRTPSYKQYIHNTKMKVATRNNLLRKLANSKWDTSASTIRITALTLCYSVAEYAASVWARSHHAHVLDLEFNTACRAITGCLKPTNVEDLYPLPGISLSDI